MHKVARTGMTAYVRMVVDAEKLGESEAQEVALSLQPGHGRNYTGALGTVGKAAVKGG